MDRDDLWVLEHFNQMVTKHAGKHVGALNEPLVAGGDSRREVEDKAREVESRKIRSMPRVRRKMDTVCVV
jgi:hypothetical protein